MDTGYWWTPPSGNARDVNSGLYPERGVGHTVPTLTEVFDEFAEAHPDLVFFLDFKAEAAVIPAMRLVQERGKLLEDRVFCGAVSPSINRALLAARPPGIPVAVDFFSMLKILVLYWIGFVWLAYPLQHQILGFFVNDRISKLMTRDLFRTLKAGGSVIALFGPGVNNKADQQKYIEMGADMIVTDRPDLLTELFDEQKRANISGSSSSTSALAT